MIAALKSGRSSRLIEYDPSYCDVIVRRYEAVTDKSATLTRTGQTFEDVAALTRASLDAGEGVAATIESEENMQ
jgi:hypothetical protein